MRTWYEAVAVPNIKSSGNADRCSAVSPSFGSTVCDIFDSKIESSAKRIQDSKKNEWETCTPIKMRIYEKIVDGIHIYMTWFTDFSQFRKAKKYLSSSEAAPIWRRKVCIITNIRRAIGRKRWQPLHCLQEPEIAEILKPSVAMSYNNSIRCHSPRFLLCIWL